MGYSLQRAYRDSLVLSGESNEEIDSWREELLDEIFSLKEERDALFGDVNLPEKIKGLKEELEGLKKKRGKLVGEIESLEISRIRETEVKMTGKLRKLSDREQKYFATIDILKKEIKMLAGERSQKVVDNEKFDHLFRESVFVHNNEIESLKSRIADAKTELNSVLAEIKAERGRTEEERTALNEEIEKLRERTEAFNGDFKAFSEKKAAFEAETKAVRAEVDAQKADVGRLKKELADKISGIETLKAGYETKDIEIENEKIELRAWRDRLEKKEAMVLRREEDLNTNWTVFEQSKKMRER